MAAPLGDFDRTIRPGETTMSRPSLRGRFTWHELMSTDPKAAIAFYQKIVGWKTEGWDQNPSYITWMGSRGPVGGVMALSEESKAMGARPGWLCYIGTPDIEGTVRDAIRLGGRVAKEITSVPMVGRFAVLVDPQGAVFAVLQPETPMPARDEAELGEFSWHELVTTDWSAAFRFYQELFGWELTDSMNMGPMGIYQMYGWSGLSLGGMYNKPADMPGPPHWLAYAVVKDSKVAADVIKKNGGTVMHGPSQVPGGGWITIAMDPQGLEFATHSKPAATPEKTKPVSVKARSAGKKTAKGAKKKTAKGAKKIAKRAPKTAKRVKAAKPRKAKSGTKRKSR